MAAASAFAAHDVAASNGFDRVYVVGLLACVPASALCAWYLVRTGVGVDARRGSTAFAAVPISLGLVLFWMLSSAGLLALLLCGVSLFAGLTVAAMYRLRRGQGS